MIKEKSICGFYGFLDAKLLKSMFPGLEVNTYKQEMSYTYVDFVDKFELNY